MKVVEFLNVLSGGTWVEIFDDNSNKYIEAGFCDSILKNVSPTWEIEYVTVDTDSSAAWIEITIKCYSEAAIT